MKGSTFGLVVAFVAVIAVTWLFSARYQGTIMQISVLEDRVTAQQGVIVTQADVIERLVTALIETGLTPEQVQEIVGNAIRGSAQGPTSGSQSESSGGGTPNGGNGDGGGKPPPKPEPEPEPSPTDPPLVCLPEPVGCV